MRPGHGQTELPLLGLLFIVVFFGTSVTRACELCAIYNASNANAEFTRGFVFSVAEQYTRFGTERFDDQRVVRNNPDFLDSSITHFVPGYNFSSRFGIGLSIPILYRSFRRTD